MALTTVTVHGELLDPNGNVPAVGTVTWRILHELQDVVDNVTYSPATYIATLDALGEFTIVLPATDNPDITPLNWVYQVYVATDVWTEVLYFQLPFSVGVTEFADLQPLDFDPCAGSTALPTPIAPSDYDLFVRRAGDTMTGNLILAGGANLTVTGSVGVTGLVTAGVSVNTPQVTASNVNASNGTFTNSLNVTYDGDVLSVGQLLAMAQSTCVFGGGEFTPNGATQIDISAATGIIVNYNSSVPVTPTNPAITLVTYPGVVALTPSFAPFTYYMVNSAGVLIQQATEPTPTQRRQNIFLGLTLTQGGIIVVDQTLPVIPSQLNNQFVDLCESLNAFNTGGNVISANGINLNINKTVGQIFSRAFSQVPTYQDPHNSTLPAQTPMQYRHITRLPGSAGPIVTALNVGFYDNGGVLTPVGGGANTSTNFRVWGFANNTVTEQILVQYGQSTFASLAAAVQGIPAGVYVPNPATTAGALLGWISVTRTATDLSNITQAVFTVASKFATP
jgi:hypothetical protein